MLSAGSGVPGRMPESGDWDVLCRANANSRRTAVHSLAERLLCWKRSIKGVERRREVYDRCNCDLRRKAGLWEGGASWAWRAIGRSGVCICSGEAAGTVAAAVAYLHLCGAAWCGFDDRVHFNGCGRNRGRANMVMVSV